MAKLHDAIDRWHNEELAAAFEAVRAVARETPTTEHALHFDPDCEECVYLARPNDASHPTYTVLERLDTPGNRANGVPTLGEPNDE
jgi:hypothetical protein